MEDYEIITRLGGGSFADVFKALEKSTGEYVAIKVLKKKYSKWEDCLELRECRSLQKLQEDHLSHQPGTKHIIKLKQIIFIKESGTLNLIFEYMENAMTNPFIIFMYSSSFLNSILFFENRNPCYYFNDLLCPLCNLPVYIS